MVHHLPAVDRREVVGEKVGEIVHGKQLSVGFEQGLALAPHDTDDFSIPDFNKILGVVAYEWMGEIPKAGAHHTADTVSDMIAVVVKHFDDTVVAGGAIPVMRRGLVGVGCAFAAVGVNDVTAKSTLDLFAIGIGESGSGGEDMSGTMAVAWVAVAIAGQQIEGAGVRADE